MQISGIIQQPNIKVLPEAVQVRVGEGQPGQSCPSGYVKVYLCKLLKDISKIFATMRRGQQVGPDSNHINAARVFTVAMINQNDGQHD